jgi:hypothetical protein
MERVARRALHQMNGQTAGVPISASYRAIRMADPLGAA